MKKTRWIRPIAATLFFFLIAGFIVEIHVFLNKEIPLIIYSKAEMVWHMGKTTLAAAFAYGVWKGYI